MITYIPYDCVLLLSFRLSKLSCVLERLASRPGYARARHTHRPAGKARVYANAINLPAAHFWSGRSCGKEIRAFFSSNPGRQARHSRTNQAEK